MNRRHEKPIKRVSRTTGRVSWVARWTDAHGKRHSAGSFKTRGPCQEQTPSRPPYGVECCAQHAIWAAYAQPAPLRRPDTVGAYAETWLERKPRAPRTNVGYLYRLRCVLDVELDGRPLRDWPMADVRRRQVHDLVSEVLVVQKRARRGALSILWVLSGMWQDAIDDEAAEVNPFSRVTIKPNDPRIAKAATPIRVFTWEQMHGFARAASEVRTGKHGVSELDRWRAAYAEAMVRVLSDCGLRLGELLGLYREDTKDGLLQVRRTAWHGRLQDGTKTDHGQVGAGRVVPLPEELAGLLAALPARIDTPLLFPGVRGGVWQESLFYRDVWRPAQAATGLDPRPHEFRHSFTSLVRAAGVDDADLAKITGHTVQTMVSTYTHSLGRSFDAVRQAVGG